MGHSVAVMSTPSCAQPLVFDNLSNELIIKIFSQLPMKDLLRSCCRVSRKWRTLSRAPELWRHVTLDVNKLGLLKRGNMDYRPTLITDDIFTSLTSLSDGIVNVDLTNCNALSVEAIIAMTRRCPQLRSLNLTRSTLPLDSVLAQLSTNCPLLESLALDGCNNEFTDDSLRSLVSGCRRLKKLNLDNNFSLSDASLLHLAQYAPQLEYLSLDRRGLALHITEPPDLITDKGLQHLAEGCAGLEQLDISCRYNLTAKGFRHLAKLRSLRTLEMVRVTKVTGENEEETRSLLEAILAIVDANSSTLESLDVSILERIDDDFITRLSRKAKSLRWLFIRGSTELTGKGLEALADHCSQLTKLELSWCQKLTDEGVKYLVNRRPTLSFLNLLRCDNVTDACVDQLMESHPSVKFQTTTLALRQLLVSCR